MPPSDLQYQAEYAKSGRAGCKGCKSNIAQSSLRIAKMIQSPHFDGKMPHWYHFACFFKKFKPKTHDEIGKFNSLRWDDQEQIKEKLGGGGGGGGSDGATTSKDQVDAATPSVKLNDEFQVEYSKSGRAKCRYCEDKIEKDVIRLAKMVEPGEEARYNLTLIPAWYHLECFLKSRGQLKAQLLAADEVPGFHTLSSEDQELVKQKLGNLNKPIPEQKPKRGRKAKNTKQATAAKETSAEKKLKLQNKKYWEIRDELYRNFANSFLKGLLEANDYDASGGESKLLDRCADGFMFGALELCPECENGRLTYSSDGYTCTGNISGWTRCTYVTLKPKRRLWVIPEEYKEDNPFLSNFKLKVEERLFPPGTSEKLAAAKAEATAEVKNTKQQLDEVDGADSKGGKKKRKVQKSGFESTSEKKAKLTLKGGAVVDPDSGKEDCCHVLSHRDCIYAAVLGQVDLSRGTNSYYKVQILEHDTKKNKYFVFRSWGRVGTTIGGNKLEKFDDSEDAIFNFKEVYEEKTGNSWNGRKNFVKYPYKFYPIDIDYGQDDEVIQNSIAAGSISTLAKPIQSLMKLIFDIEAMKHALVEFEIDLKKMPLGKLSKKQIEMAYKCLSECQQFISDGTRTGGKILDASNRFFTLIPHDFGMKQPPLIDNEEYLNLKIQMLDSLLEIEVAYSLMKGSKGNDEKDPLDVHYESLNTNMTVVENASEEFAMICEFVKNTHAKTHSSYSLTVDEVFTIERNGERQRYRPFKDLHNRKLLWHGSRSTNYAGILSQGLRIAPPEAPVTGYMFGKGVYFADMASKSANYCYASRSTNNVGLMLLCEVALGNTYDLTTAKHITKLPAGKHSCKGLGATSPDPSGDKVLPDGVVVPMGAGKKDTKMKTTLLYNEYIVYDTSQINMKYLVKLKYNFKY